MDGCIESGAPFDEEWEQAVAVVFERERLPVEDAAVGTFARAGCGPTTSTPSTLEALSERFDVAGMLRPADDHRFFKRTEIALVVGCGLLRIGRDDFEIAIRAEREQRVARARAGMDSAERGANAGALFDKLDACVEVGASDQNMIEQFGSGLLWRCIVRCARRRARHSP